jgi:hypothetical protein
MDDSRFSEKQVVNLLDGPVLAEHHSMVDGAMVRWNPKSHQLSFVLEDDDEIAEACEEYLVSKGRNFGSIDELVRYAETHQWSGWEKIRGQFDGTSGDDDEFDVVEL